MNIAKQIESAWFKRFSLISVLLLPLTLLFWLLSSVNRMLFKVGLKRAYKSPVPVIVVGNISVGGNGKTPMVIYLANLLKEQGKHVGIISRGYGARPASTPFAVKADTSTHEGGDEPVLLAKRTGCPVYIGGDRKASIEKMMSEHSIDVIISDDGLQHYALARDIELCIVDAKRQYGNRLLMPSGPLREGTWRLQSVDLVVFNGLTNGQASYVLEATGLHGVADEQPINPPFPSGCALSAIGNPKRFYDSLSAYGVNLDDERHFRDHHHFEPQDIPSGVTYMTEKDAVKCRSFAHEQCYYLRVDAIPNALLKQQLNTILKDKGVL
ncbi:tetraacyldisaccharide 4'-kinase [Pseudoalteromonas sp. SSDWG2]|uniref:tetraacyldisaccharide 4'-kinase n=1 Tax=Pseudoalteromonas sp. SSDWG2 TaxID=3139391 RepID=UPI003BA8A710